MKPCLSSWFRSRLTLSLAVVLASLGTARAAHARDVRVIHDWRAPVDYQLELEPHLLAGVDPPGPGVGTGVGVGVRGSLVVLPDGFLRNVNDSVAIGIGLDYGQYHYGAWEWSGTRDQCLHFAPGPAGTQVCTQVTSYGGVYNYVYVPVVMQWNFWLTRRFSAFAEPGLALYFIGHHTFDVSPALYAGGRFMVSDKIAITARVGYPDFTLGASFFL